MYICNGLEVFMSIQNQKHRGKGIRIPGLLLVVFMFFILIFFVSVIISTKMLPTGLLAVVCAGCLISLLLIYFLTRDFRHKIRFVLGIIWSLLCLILCLCSGYYVRQTQNTLQKVSSPNVQNSVISFYVRQDDKAASLSDATSYTFGILQTLDRKNTDKTLNQVSTEQGLTLDTSEYEGLTQLADALRTEQIDGILLNQAYLDLYEELEGYETFPEEIRTLSTQQVEQVVENILPEKTSSGSVINIYISGSDTRDSTLSALTRSDVNIIASVNTQTGEVLLLSTPRDYYVPLSISGGIPDKLTHAGIYGIQVSMDTLSMLYDIQIDYYFKVNFTGFVDIVNSLGGIEVQSDYEFDSNGYHFTQGTNTLDGDAALAFCRERYSFSSGDRQRGRNQMAVIEGIIRKAASPSILTSYTSILEGVQNCIDTNIPYDLMAELVRQQLSQGTKWKVTTYSVDGTGDTQVPYSMSSRAYVMVPDMTTVEHAKELLAQIAGN